MNNGTVLATGYNGWGAVGDGTNSDRWTPTTVRGLSGVAAVHPGYGSGFAITTDGTLWAWGYNGSGQLGNGTFGDANSRSLPGKVGAS